MTDEIRPTREEEAYMRLLRENREILSEAACTVFGEAQSTSSKEHHFCNIAFQDWDYYEAMDKMRLAADGLTDQDCNILAEFCRAAMAAAASIDSHEMRHAHYDEYREADYDYYRRLASMVQQILEEKRTQEILQERKANEPRKIAEGEPEDSTDHPF